MDHRSSYYCLHYSSTVIVCYLHACTDSIRFSYPACAIYVGQSGAVCDDRQGRFRDTGSIAIHVVGHTYGQVYSKLLLGGWYIPCLQYSYERLVACRMKKQPKGALHSQFVSANQAARGIARQPVPAAERMFHACRGFMLIDFLLDRSS